MFIPILFLKGLAGVILSDVALTIIWAIGSSMIVAVVVVPFLCAYLLRPVTLNTNTLKGRLSAAWDRGYSTVERIYESTLKRALRNRGFVLFIAVMLLALSVLSAGLLGFEFISETDMNEVDLVINFPSSYTLEDNRDRLTEMDMYIRSIVPEIETTAFYAGTDSALGLFNQDNAAFARIRLVPSSQRDRSVFDIISDLRRTLPARFGDMELTIENGGLGQLMNMATGGGGLVIDVYGSDINELYDAARNIASVIEQDRAVDEVSLNLDFSNREMIVSVDQEAAGQLGVTSYDVALMSRILFNGAEAGLYRQEGTSWPITVKSDLAKSAIRQDTFDTLYMTNLNGSNVPYSAITSVSVENTVNQISKKNKMKTVTVQALLNDPDLGGIQKRVLPVLRDMDLPLGVRWEIAGSAASMQESFSSLFLLLGISLFLVYMVMVIQFERFVQPLIVMVSIPFAFIGIVLSLTAFRSTLSIVSILGIITLAGTVVNTAIVLIDYINLMRSDSYGLGLTDAVITGCKNRLRPILMSVLTTVIGLIPLSFAAGEGSEVYAPLGQAILGGLLTSTFITLILIPVLYQSVEQRKERRKTAQMSGGENS